MATGRPTPQPASPSRLGRNLPLLVGSVAIGFGLLLSACGQSEANLEPVGGSFHPDGFEGVIARPPDDLLDPVAAGEPPPDGFRQVLDRDDILPVYQPRFVTTANAGWEPEELIVGVDLEGEARAYPVDFLNSREIVVDLHRGIPTFVTW